MEVVEMVTAAVVTAKADTEARRWAEAEVVGTRAVVEMGGAAAVKA